MSVDDVLLVIIIAGMVLSGAYLRAQYTMRRRYRTAERRKELRLRELYHSRAETRVPRAAVSRNAVPDAMLLRNSLQVRVRFAYRSPAARREQGAKALEASH